MIITNVGWVFVEYQDQYWGKNSIFLELNNCCTLPHSKALMGRSSGEGRKTFTFFFQTKYNFSFLRLTSALSWGREKHWKKLFLDLWLYTFSSIFLRGPRVLESMVLFSMRAAAVACSNENAINSHICIASLIVRYRCECCAIFIFVHFEFPKKALCNRIFITWMNGLADGIQFANLSWSKGRRRSE